MELNKYKIEWTAYADEKLNKLDNSIKIRILKFLRKDSVLSNPRSAGKPLQHDLSGLWRYRVDGFRIIVEIKDDVLIVLVVKIDRRDEIYHN
jgi:mRNA interferase RelE/StbE